MIKIKPEKLHIISLGCSKNLIDSEVMGGLLCKSGLQLVDQSDAADIVIVNTCAFINPAKEEALEEILTLVETKKRQLASYRLLLPGASPSVMEKNYFPRYRK